MVRTRARSSPAEGLAALRRGGATTELLFLYACATLDPTQLRPVARELGLTVQAASHSFRQLRDRGLVAVEDGRYRPTVEGVAWLHESLTHLAQDVHDRIDRLHVIRSTRAVAASGIRTGDPVSLELRHGLLTARKGREGPSRGRATTSAAAGELVEVGDLEGIVPIVPARVVVRTVSEVDLNDASLPARLRAILPPREGVLAAQGLEAFHSLRRATDRPIQRFAAAAGCLEASRLGVPSTVVVLGRDLPELLQVFSVSNPPPLDVGPLSPRAGPSSRVLRQRS